MRGILLSYMCAGLLATAGCGSGASGAADRVDVYPVSGTVSLNGAPLADASITFSPLTNGIPAAIGRTDAQGNYVLTTYEAQDGAAAGEFKVLVSKYVAPAEAAGDEEIPHGTDPNVDYEAGGDHDSGGAGGASGNVVPPHYGSPSGSPLVATVKEDGENTFDFNIL